MKTTLRTLLATGALMLLSIVPLPRASAQVPPDVKSLGIYQHGVLVGEIYRSDTDPNNYSEHWVLYPGYVYPSERNGIETSIRPGRAEYRDLRDFLARVPFGTGARYVVTSCN